MNALFRRNFPYKHSRHICFAYVNRTKKFLAGFFIPLSLKNDDDYITYF